MLNSLMKYNMLFPFNSILCLFVPILYSLVMYCDGIVLIYLNSYLFCFVHFYVEHISMVCIYKMVGGRHFNGLY